MQLLKGKSALITGGTAGIGKAIACLYAKHGADVAIFGTNKERAEAAVKEMEAIRIDPAQKGHLILKSYIFLMLNPLARPGFDKFVKIMAGAFFKRDDP